MVGKQLSTIYQGVHITYFKRTQVHNNILTLSTPCEFDFIALSFLSSQQVTQADVLVKYITGPSGIFKTAMLPSSAWSKAKVHLLTTNKKPFIHC